MTNLLLPLWIIIYLLFAFPSVANEARLQHLISQAEAALARNDDGERRRIVDEIFVLTTGIDAPQEGKPDGLSVAEYERILCPFRKAIASLSTTQEIQYLHHKMRYSGFNIVHKKEENAPYVLAIIECVQDDGEPVPDSLALTEGIKWARKIKTADIAELQVMLREYEELIKSRPDDPYYLWLDLTISSVVTGKRIDGLLENTNKLLTEGILYQARLVEKADKSDVAAQLEVARRLETGDRFRQENKMAYYWYKRALQNNGGETAQNGLDRLHPLLDWLDHYLVNMWLKKKHRPY